LIPDETDAEHASGHQTIWYGVLPVGAIERDGNGNPIFDDKASYEVRCFVKRHKDPKSNKCCGEVVWSRPTESYQLAPHFDLIGTSNRLTIIQAPDLGQLAQQLGDPGFNIGQGLGLGIASPAGSELPAIDFEDGKPVDSAPGGLPSICFFAIPLITIIAMFLLRLVLPIVVFVFGLWFLLKLKLCILPQISIDVDLEFDVGIEGSLELAIEAELKADVSFKTNILDSLAPSMKKYFEEKLDDASTRDQAYKDLANLAAGQSIDFSESGVAPELVEQIQQMAADQGIETNPSSSSALPNPEDRLDYYPTKKLSEVFA